MIFELRHYTAVDGKGEALRQRFTEHAFAAFAAVDFVLRDFWQETERSGHFWYILEWSDVAARQQGWQRLREDPAWRAIKVASEADGPLIASIDSILLERLPEPVRPAAARC